jgi:uncharacterized protein (TIGR03435 family)
VIPSARATVWAKLSSLHPQLSAPGLGMMEGVRGTAIVSLLTARAQPLSALTELLSKEFRLPVIDKTGLTGKFDFTLEFAPQTPGALPPESPNDSARSAASIMARLTPSPANGDIRWAASPSLIRTTFHSSASH